MVGSVNKVIIVGNLGADPEIRATQDGREIANLSVATGEQWKDKNTGEKRTKTEWHRVVVFQPGLVNIIKQYVKKGSKVYIEGSLQTRKWTDSNGADRYSTEVVLQGYSSVFTMLDNVQSAAAGSFGASNIAGNATPNDSNQKIFSGSGAKTNDVPDDFDDEIPF